MHYITGKLVPSRPPGMKVAGPGLGSISSLWCPLSLPSITCICSLHDLQTCKSCRFISTCGVPYFYFFVKPMADGPSFSYEKLVRETWYKKLVRVS